MPTGRISDRVKRTESLSLLAVARLAEGLENVIYLNIGEPDFGTPDHIREAAKEAISKGYTHYTPDAGIPELREAIAEKESAKGVDISPEQVLVTPGSTGGIYSAVMATVNPGDEVLLADPWYPGYRRAVQLAGGRLVGIPTRDEEGFSLNPDVVNELASSGRAKLIIVASPNNPTGALYSREVLRAIAEIAVDRGLWVLSDEVYEKFVYEGRKFVSMLEFPGMEEHAIIVNSFSKTYAMTGWRVGYAVGPKEVIEEMGKVNLATAVCVTSIAQYAALAALKGPQDCVERMVREYDERRSLVVRMMRGIPGVKFAKPYGAFYVFPNVEQLGMPSEDLAKFLAREARVVVSPGYPHFGPGGRGHIRISYSTSKGRLEEAMRRIGEALEKLQ